MDKSNFALGRQNFIIIAVSVAVIVLGFILMSGGGSTEETFNEAIFSARRIKVAPIVCLAGFLLMVYGIIRKPKSTDETEQ